MKKKKKYDLKDTFREFGKLGNPGTPDKYFKREKYLFGLLGKKGEEITNGIIYKKNDLGLINWEVCYNNTKEYEKTWYDNGQLSSEYYYKDGGLLIDWVKEYYENGRLEHEIQTNGNIKWYYKNGKLKLEDVVIEGKITDSQHVYYRKTYYENGQLKSEKTFKNGKLDGPFKYFNLDGQLRSEGNFKQNKHCGLWKYFYDPETKELFVNGVWYSHEFINNGKHINIKKYNKNNQIVDESTVKNKPENTFGFKKIDGVRSINKIENLILNRGKELE